MFELDGKIKCPDNPGGLHRWDGDGQCLDCCNYATDLIDSVSGSPTPKICEWFEDDDGWHSGCGKDWEFIYDGPTENGMKFCIRCGDTVFVDGLAADDGSPTPEQGDMIGVPAFMRTRDDSSRGPWPEDSTECMLCSERAVIYLDGVMHCLSCGASGSDPTG